VLCRQVPLGGIDQYHVASDLPLSTKCTLKEKYEPCAVDHVSTTPLSLCLSLVSRRAPHSHCPCLSARATTASATWTTPSTPRSAPSRSPHPFHHPADSLFCLQRPGYYSHGGFGGPGRTGYGGPYGGAGGYGGSSALYGGAYGPGYAGGAYGPGYASGAYAPGYAGGAYGPGYAPHGGCGGYAGFGPGFNPRIP